MSLSVLAACSNSKSVGSENAASATTLTSSIGTGSTTEPAAATADTTVVEPTTTLGPTTTTTVVTPSELTLGEAGVGGFALGSAAGPVVAGLSAELGTPTRYDEVAYPLADGFGEYTSAVGDTGFVAPMGRTVCWSVNLCAEFGGASDASMSFTGWTYSNDPTSALSSASGGTIGARWSDLSALEVDAGGCYSVGSGTIDGIRVALESSGDPFSSFDDAGNYVANVPSPGDVSISSMETGKVPVFLYGDC